MHLALLVMHVAEDPSWINDGSCPYSDTGQITVILVVIKKAGLIIISREESDVAVSDRVQTPS